MGQRPAGTSEEAAGTDIDGSPPAQQPGWIRRLVPYLRRYVKELTIVFVAAIGSQVITVIVPIIMMWVVDDAIFADRRPLGPLLLLMLALGALRFGIAFVRRYFGARVSMGMEYDMRNSIYDHLQRLDFARHDQMQTGQLVSRANTDVRMVQGLFGSFLPQISANIVFFFIALAVMLSMSVRLTTVALVTVPIVITMASRMRKVVYPSSWDAMAKHAEVTTVVEEAVTGVRVVKGFGQERRELNRLIDKAATLFGARMRNTRISLKRQIALQFVPQLAQVANLAFGGWLVLTGEITIGMFMAFSSYLVQLIGPAQSFAGMLVQAQQTRAAAERIFEVLDSTPLVTQKPDAVELSSVQGDVVFEAVGFGYMRSEPVLDGLDLRIRPGETVALVGASGSGKSTVALLLPRFYDVQQGAVRIDGIDVRDATLASLRRQIGFVFEESFLFSDTVRANITYGRPGCTDEEMIAAAKGAEAHEFIMELPEGYETVVGERGLTLSGGQRQRVALARAIITDPKILVLDDATSSVDARVEEEIHHALRRVMHGRTTLIVAHRRSTLDLADRIVVLRDGRVLDAGTHDELMQRCEHYREMLGSPGDNLSSGVAQGPVRTPDAWREVPPEIALTGGTGWGGLDLSNPQTKELFDAIERLPPMIDEPDVDVEMEARHDTEFILRRFLYPYRRLLVIALALVSSSALIGLSGPLFVRLGIDHGIIAGSQSTLWTFAALFLGVVVAARMLSYIVGIFTSKLGQRLLFALKVRVFAQLQRLGVDYYDREMAGRIMTRMTSDVEAIHRLLQQGVIQAVVQAVTLIGVTIILFVMNWRLALYVMLVVPAMVAATWWFRVRAERIYEKTRERLATVNANFQESISGVRVAQAYVREQQNMDEFRRDATEYLEARLEGQRVSSMYFPFVEVLSTVAMVLVLLGGQRLVGAGELSAGELVAFILYINTVFGPIQQLSQLFDTYQQARVALGKIRELMGMTVTTPEADRPVEPGRPRGHIRFENVRFRYVGAPTEALSGVSLEIFSGQTIALVGETGAGKSTIVKLIARFYDPTSGRVLIDGRPLHELDLERYRSQLGYVPQESFLFTGSIRDNIAYGRPDATDAQVEAAARAVGAHDFIEKLTYGYNQPVTERGRSLSAGQRQLIALARALLVDPAILILDEATANLDLTTEARVAHAMGLVSEGRTTLLIAHRLQSAQRSDRIFVVDDGRVVEDGTHEELLALGGRYADLWRSFAMEPADVAEPVTVAAAPGSLRLGDGGRELGDGGRGSLLPVVGDIDASALSVSAGSPAPPTSTSAATSIDGAGPAPSVEPLGPARSVEPLGPAPSGSAPTGSPNGPAQPSGAPTPSAPEGELTRSPRAVPSLAATIVDGIGMLVAIVASRASTRRRSSRDDRS